MLVAGHLGCTQKDGQYFRTRDLGMCEQFMDDLLTHLGTDHIDILMMHFVDTLDDAQACLDPEGFLGLAQRYVMEGKARMLGFSGHSPVAAKALMETGLFDAMMFSVNPAMDLMPPDSSLDDLFGEKLNRYQVLSISEHAGKGEAAQMYREI
jgi:predicted oxidoreductase